MTELRPTVKRDLSLFSVEAWREGYIYYLKYKLGWRYEILFFYDGQKVNFYHRKEDFGYFKGVITGRLLKDDGLFDRLNLQFQSDVTILKKLYAAKKFGDKELADIFHLIGKIMSFYIFVVSDDFVKARPSAWPSRNMSEGILYEVDSWIEKSCTGRLKKARLDPALAHVLTVEEIGALLRGRLSGVEKIGKRKSGYIIFRRGILTNVTFPEFCQKNGFVNPELTADESVIRLEGQGAAGGKISGKVRLVMTRADLSEVRKGDILVSIMTNASMAPAFSKAAAVVTDEGGITCHAAITARELKNPVLPAPKSLRRCLRMGILWKWMRTRGWLEF